MIERALGALQSGRAHQFWFSHRQGEVNFECRTGSGQALEVKNLSGDERRREFQILFPRELQPLERIRYQIRFEVKREFPEGSPHFYYYLSPRTVTRELRCEVRVPWSCKLANFFISHESADGFLCDDVPLIAFEEQSEQRRLYWSVKNPRPGDLFKTFWEYPKEEHERGEKARAEEQT